MPKLLLLDLLLSSKQISFGSVVSNFETLIPNPSSSAHMQILGFYLLKCFNFFSFFIFFKIFLGRISYYSMRKTLKIYFWELLLSALLLQLGRNLCVCSFCNYSRVLGFFCSSPFSWSCIIKHLFVYTMMKMDLCVEEEIGFRILNKLFCMFSFLLSIYPFCKVK